MRTPEEILDLMNLHRNSFPNGDSRILEIIKLTQAEAHKEGWNEATLKAAEDVEHVWDNHENELFDIDKQSILQNLIP